MRFGRYNLLWFFLIYVKILPAALNPSLVGWGNLLLPGAGATLRDHPFQGILEATAEIGLFYGGTYGAREGDFSIDSTILTPKRGNLYQPLVGLTMQQIGLKLHMYNTFYHYQQASLGLEASGVKLESPQPLYRGTTGDVLAAPFAWKNLSEPLVFGAVLASAAYLVYDYHTAAVKRQNFAVNGGEEALYGTYNMAVEPLGSAFGEEPLFRGFMQREFHGYTGSLPLAILMQTTLFTLLHTQENRGVAFAGGLYFGFLTHHFDGNIEQATAAHFWINVVNGVFTYLRFRLAHGKDAPFSPPVNLTLGMPL